MNSFNSKKTLDVNGKSYTYFSLPAAAKALGINLSDLPYSMRVLFENLLRNEDGKTVKEQDIRSIADWLTSCSSTAEIAYRPARVLMQDFTGVPAVVDLAAMRDAVAKLGSDAQKINPQVPVDLVIDHSVMVDSFGTGSSFADNVAIEMSRNAERYKFLKWGQGAFENFRVVPPGTGICHQVNLEYLAHVVMEREVDGEHIAYPDTCVGTDSHTTMINGLAVLGWGVGGIEAEAAMLGQPISMLLPEVVGFKLTGAMTEGTTATDLVLTVTQMLRERGVVGKFVEFYGDGIHNLSLADRATIANMAPEYGATCGFFPVDEETINYMKLSSREAEKIALTEAYSKAQGMWHENSAADPKFTDTLALDIGTVVPTIAGPKNPQERISLSDSASNFKTFSDGILASSNTDLSDKFAVKNKDYTISHGDIFIAAITSCTNTSNPSVMIAAGIVAQKAAALGLKVKPWVKTSLAPGSKVVTEYLDATNLSVALNDLGFNLVGYGCTTCIGNSGPLAEEIEEAINEHDIIATSVLSGNRNFEGRVHPKTKGNYLMSPPLVVAYAIAGNMSIDIAKDAIAQDANGNDVYLKDIWPSSAEVQEAVNKSVTPEMFARKYADVFAGTKEWQDIATSTGEVYDWDADSTYIKNPPYFEGMTMELASKNANVSGAKMLALLGDFITTDHISPAGVIAKNGPAAEYLAANGVEPRDFNSFGSRRGNHEVMMRGTFANVKIKNELAPGTEGGVTTYTPTGDVMSIYDAAMKYKESSTPLVVFGGKSYGMGSSRDWAAKGTTLLGIKAVIAESFERIHRSNLVGMGVLPLMFKDGTTRETLKLDGSESFAISGLENGTSPKSDVTLTITRANGSTEDVALLCRIDTADEVDYFENGGILQNVIRGLCV
jgi:aconitate hydratase